MTRQELKQTLETAADLHRLGRIAEAEPLYRQVLDAAPRHADALHLLGLALHQSGTGSEAVDLVRRAIAERPNVPDFYSNLARMLENLGRADEAGLVVEQRGQLEQWLREYGDLPADFRDYQLGVERKRLSPYLDYPREVTIETLALCNAACEFCPYPDLERQGTRMSDALVEKICAISRTFHATSHSTFPRSKSATRYSTQESSTSSSAPPNNCRTQPCACSPTARPLHPGTSNDSPPPQTSSTYGFPSTTTNRRATSAS